MIKFLRIPKNRKYDYKPVYYDPLEDELKERVRMIEAEIDIEEGLLAGEELERYQNNSADRLSKKFQYAKEQNMRSHKGGYSVTRIFLILVAILYVIYRFLA